MTAIPPDEFVPPDPPTPSPDEPTGVVNTEWALVVSSIVGLVSAAVGLLSIAGIVVPDGLDDAVGKTLLAISPVWVAVGALIRGRQGTKHGVYSERTVYRIDPAATRR